MNSFKAIKWLVIGGWLVGSLLVIVGHGSSSKSNAADGTRQRTQPTPAPAADYVGSDTCATCHEDQFKNFSRTPHARLAKEPSWNNKVHGCESCHGAGRAHVEGGGDKTKIRTFENEPPKRISETCLACHAGREEHNNYRRGEHWRNDVGCIDCHSVHDPDPPAPRPGSITLATESAHRKPDSSVLRMLRGNEANLCLRCHTEQKAQFTMPFRHKVLEGTMKCSDCHNPHGGFELKQTRLAVGSDATCVKCHTDKQGPFVYEHGPVKVEGCSSCHTPHGATNPKLLRRNEMFQLCIECHTNAHAIAGDDEDGGAPNTPSFHNLTTERFRNCTTCHVMIHGSNTHPFFFR